MTSFSLTTLTNCGRTGSSCADEICSKANLAESVSAWIICSIYWKYVGGTELFFLWRIYFPLI